MYDDLSNHVVLLSVMEHAVKKKKPLVAPQVPFTRVPLNLQGGAVDISVILDDVSIFRRRE